jgi:hypothetical protein
VEQVIQVVRCFHLPVLAEGDIQVVASLVAMALVMALH